MDQCSTAIPIDTISEPVASHVHSYVSLSVLEGCREANMNRLKLIAILILVHQASLIIYDDEPGFADQIEPAFTAMRTELTGHGIEELVRHLLPRHPLQGNSGLGGAAR
jgi:hypothetical protein